MRYEDHCDCETCGTSYSTIYYVSQQPFDSDEGEHEASFGDHASCYDSKDGRFEDVVNYINQTYSKNIDLSLIKYPESIGMSFDECERLYDSILIEHFKNHDINLTITHEESQHEDDDYDEWDNADDECINIE